MGKKLTADKIKALEENANILMQQGASQGDIDLMTSQFIEEFGVDDAMPEKKNEVQGLNVEVGTSVGSSVKSPVSSIKTEQNVGLSPSGKKGIDILRGASVKPISPTKTAIPQTPKKKKSKVEELRKSIQQKVAVGEPLTTDEVSEVRDISSNVFLPLDGLKDGEVNAVLAGAQNKQNQQLISKSRNDQYQKQLKDRIVSGEVLPEDIKGMYDVSGFAPPDTDFEKLANDWNAENIKIKQKIDSELLNESTKADKYIVDLDDKIRNLERQAVETRRTSTNEMDIEAQSATDGAIRNLKSIKYKAQEYLDYLSEKAIDTSKDEIIKRVNKIQGVRDEKGLVKDVVSLEQVVDDYISTQPTEKQNLLLRKKPYLVESLVASEYVIPKANEVFYQKAESIISDVPQSAKQLFKRVTGEIDVKDGEEKYYDTQQQFAIANNAASLYFMDEVVRTNQAFESVVSLPNVRNAVGGKLDVLKQQYDAGQISASDYKLKRLQALSLNPQTSEYVKEYVRKIQNAQERYESKIDKFLQSKVPDFAKFTEVDESGNIVSIAGMKPMEFTQKMTELQTAKTESLNEAASMYKTDIENRAVERRGELFGRGIKSWVGASFAKGTHGLFESMGRWAYDNTGLEFFDASRRGATDMLYNASVPFESQEVQDIMDIEAGDYAKAFNPLYITGVASESAPYMLATIAAGIASGGLAEGVLLGMGLSEGIGAAITLSRAGRVAQKTIAAISSGTSDAYLNMTANYNDLIKEGYSKEQAKQIAFDAFKNGLPVDILSGAVEMDALFRATSKPTIKNIIKGGANKAGSILIEEPITEVYQGYSLEKAKGTSKSLVDYAFFDKEGFNNLVGGFAGGLGTSAVTNAMGIAKNALSWNRLYNVSTADMQNAVRYAGVAQMVATPSEMQNSINLDLLKSAQSISQEEYQKIPNNERAQKEKAKNEYVNRTVAYVYGKSINNSVQNGLNIEDVHEHYKAHNEAISKAYSTLAELANETNKPMYKKQADYYASLAQKSEIGQQTPIYSLITPKGRVFISEQTAKTLGEGSIQQKNDSFAKAVRAGDIIGVQVVDDSQTAQSLIKKFDDAKLSQQLAVQQSQGGATEVGQPNQTNVQTPIEGTTEIPTTKGVIDNPNISTESNPALRDVESVAKALELKNEGKADTPTKESVTERLNINNPFYKKVEDALVKLGLIEKYNPETKTGDVVGGYIQPTSDGGFSAGRMLFSQNGEISYLDGNGNKVSFDKNGNVISENTKQVAQEAKKVEIEGAKSSIISLEKTRDSEAFKYKEVTETDILGNKKKVKRLKTPQELKESTDKINDAIDKAKARLVELEKSESLLSNEQPTSTPQSESNPALRDVESVAKALRENEEKGGKPIPTTLIPKQEFEVLNNGNRGLNDIIAETYHKAKAKPENTRTEQEQELIKAVESALTGEAEKILEQQPISTTQSEIEKKTKEISDLEERLKEPLLRPVIFEDDYSPSQLRDLKETWAKQDEEERIIIRKEIAQKQAELKELEQQPILGVQPQADNTALDEFFERVARFVVTSDIEIKPITLVKQFNLGYNRATKIINQLEAAGIVEANTDDKPRKLMIQNEAELDSILENIKKPTTKSENNTALREQIESTAKALNEVTDSAFIGNTSNLISDKNWIDGKTSEENIAEQYHADKAAGKETPLTKAVESLLSKEQPISTTQSGSNPALRDVESTAKQKSDPDLANIDPVIIAARNGDKQAQKKLEEYGLDWEQTTTYRFVGQPEVDVLLSDKKVESKRFSDAGIDVTTSPKVTSAANAEYRVTFKESFDVNNGLGKVKLKSKEEGDHNLEKGRGYTLNDVAKIERLDENGNVVEVIYDSESLLSNEQPISTTQSGSNPALSDVESTAKALETESKNKPTIWEQVKQLVKGAVKKVGDKLGIISNEQHLSNFEKAKQEWDKLSPRDKKLKRADYELDDLEHTEGGYYKVGNSLIDLDLNTNHFKLLLENSKFLNILNKLGVTKIHSENRPAGEMFAHYSDGKIHLNNNSAYETEEQLSYAMSHELGHHEWTKLTKEERDYVRSLPLETGMAKHYEAQEKSGKGKETSASLQEENFADYVMQYFQGKLYGDEALLNKIPTKLRELFDNKYSDLLKDNEHTEASEAYHTAKADGSNPELVKAVESLLSNEQTPAASSDVEQFNRAKEVSLKRIKNSNDPQKIFSEINRLQETLKKSQSFVLTPEEQTLIDEKLKELKDKGYSLKTKKGEILREGENVRVDDNVTLLKASDVTEVEKSLLEKELNRRNSLKQELIKNGYSEQEATIEAGLSPEKNIDIVSQDIEVAVIKNGVQEKSGKVAIRVISIEAVESLLSKEQAPIEIDESTPFDLSIALQTKKEEQDAIQKQSTTEEVLLNERPEMGLQEVGEGNAQVEAVAEQGSQEEKIEVAPLSFTPKNFIEELIGVEGAVALSGINEQQRQELIKDRLRTTTLTPQKEKEREIVKLVKSHNGMRRNARERLDVRGRIMRLVNDYNKEYPNQKLTFKSWYGDVKVTRPSFDRKQKSTYQKDLTVANLDVSNASLDETEKTFSERSDEFQRKFIELMDLGVQFEFRDAGNKKFSQKMLDDAMNDLENGIPSRRAAVILNTVEKAIEENVITVGGSLTEGFQYIPLNLAIEETKEMKYEDELRNLSNAEIVAIYENEILAQKELDNIIQQEYETEFESDPNDEFGNVRQLAPRKKRDIINPNQEGDNQGQTSEGTIEENQNVENETPKTTANREAGENLVGGNQADIPTNADGNGQREEEITENTPKQGEEGVGVVTGAPTPVISEMDRAVLDAMKPTFEIEFIPNAKFLNTSAPLENKSSQDAIKRRYQTIKKLLECL